LAEKAWLEPLFRSSLPLDVRSGFIAGPSLGLAALMFVLWSIRTAAPASEAPKDEFQRLWRLMIFGRTGDSIYGRSFLLFPVALFGLAAYAAFGDGASHTAGALAGFGEFAFVFVAWVMLAVMVALVWSAVRTRRSGRGVQTSPSDPSAPTRRSLG
jgi:hypothetical protein